MALTYFANGKRISGKFLSAYSHYQIEIYGKSTDTKPDEVPDSTVFYEKDTKKVFLSDEENKAWIEQ